MCNASSEPSTEAPSRGKRGSFRCCPCQLPSATETLLPTEIFVQCYAGTSRRRSGRMQSQTFWLAGRRAQTESELPRSQVNVRQGPFKQSCSSPLFLSCSCSRFLHQSSVPVLQQFPVSPSAVPSPSSQSLHQLSGSCHQFLC